MNKQTVFALFDEGWSIEGIIRIYWQYPPVMFSEMWREWHENRKHETA